MDDEPRLIALRVRTALCRSNVRIPSPGDTYTDERELAEHDSTNYWGRGRRRFHSPCTARIKEKIPVTPIA
jgi:hypothetical protein